MTYFQYSPTGLLFFHQYYLKLLRSDDFCSSQVKELHAESNINIWNNTEQL